MGAALAPKTENRNPLIGQSTAINLWFFEKFGQVRSLLWSKSAGNRRTSSNCKTTMVRTFRFALVLGFGSLIASAFAQYAGAEPVNSEVKKGFDSITKADAQRWLGYLAGPECAGRGTGQPGFQKAADYMAARFKEFGLKPVGDNGTYFQGVPFTRTSLDLASSKIEVGGKTVLSGVGFQGFGAELAAKGQVVFLHATGETPRLDDPAQLNGKLVVVSAARMNNDLRRQIQRGTPAAILTVVEKPAPIMPSIRRGAGGPGRGGGGVSAQISLSDARKLAEAVGVDPASVRLDEFKTTAVTFKQGQGEASLSAKAVTEQVMVPNVVAFLPGADPTTDEIVGIGGHLDHMGVSNGVVFPGADDDGSGCTALLAVAKALTVNPNKPRRGVLFMAFCGEEMGLIGSGHYANNPIFPNEKMICELQMDMVGRNEEQAGEKPEDNVDTIHLVGSQRISMELHNLILEQNKHIGFKFEYDEEDVYTRSDHYNFAAKGIPIAFIFSGFHPDYHRPTDTIEKINFDKIVNSAKLFYLTAWQAANRPVRFAKDVKPPTGG